MEYHTEEKIYFYQHIVSLCARIYILWIQKGRKFNCTTHDDAEEIVSKQPFSWKDLSEVLQKHRHY